MNLTLLIMFGFWPGASAAAAATVQQLTVVQCDSYAAGPIAADNYAATPIAGDDG